MRGMTAPEAHRYLNTPGNGGTLIPRGACAIWVDPETGLVDLWVYDDSHAAAA